MASRGRASKQGTPFDRLIKLQCQKAVASKSSSSVVGKWGSFSYKPSDSKRSSDSSAVISGAPKPKKFFKSRDQPSQPAGDDVDDLYSDASITKIVPGLTARSGKPLEPKPPAHQIQRTHAEKKQSKFFTSKQSKRTAITSAPRSPKPRRAATSTRESYAESDSDDPSGALPPDPKPSSVVSRQQHMFISGGKPAATFLQQKQRQIAGNSEESEAGDESSADEDQPPFADFPSSEAVASNEPNTSPPTDFPDAESNGASSESESVPESKPEVEPPPLKVPPLKLIIKTGQISPPKEDKRPTRKGRARLRSDASETDEVLPAKKNRKMTEPKTDKFHRTRSRSSASDNEVQMSSLQSINDEAASVREARRGTRHTRNNSSHSDAEAPVDEDLPVRKRTARATRAYGSRNAKVEEPHNLGLTKIMEEDESQLRTFNNNASSCSSTKDAEESLGVSAEKRSVPPVFENDPQFESESPKSVSAESSISEKPKIFEPAFSSDVKTEKLDDVCQADLKTQPVPESDESSTLCRAQTVASGTDVASELKLELKSEVDRSRSSSQSVEASKPEIKPKRSIFKSKSNAQTTSTFNGTKKGLSLYRHKWNSSNEPDEFRSDIIKRALTMDAPGASTSSPFDEDFDNPGEAIAPSDFSTTKLVRVASESTDKEVVSVKCHKTQKDYFTVIKNVKKAHQIQDFGEFQEFNDDVDYILGGLGSKNSLSTRCLSAVTLASKCMEGPFRIHLRAHGTVTQFFKELKDAPQNPSLALCTATVLFVLSQDRLNMDLDRDSLELMLNLMDTDSRIKDALENSGMNQKELEKNKQKVQDLCDEMRKKGHANDLNLEQISADQLSMETLLTLTSKRAGEWFKEELRELGGLDHLMNTMYECLNFLTVEEITIWTDPLHTKIKKASRVLKVLESVTSENEENCNYLLEYNEGYYLGTLHRLLQFLVREVPNLSTSDVTDRDSVSFSMREALFDLIRVYINLAHDYRHTPKGSLLTCRSDDMIDLTLNCLYVVPESLPEEKRFDLCVLVLTFIINLVECAEDNREKLMKADVPRSLDDLFESSSKQSAISGLVAMFLENVENANSEESKTDQILDKASEEDKKKENSEDKAKSRDETVKQLLSKAGRHMEFTLIASYITIIVGYLILDSKENETEIRALMPDNNFVTMVSVLKKFKDFMQLTTSATVLSSRGLAATKMILEYLEKIDKKVEEKPERDDRIDDFDDVTLFDVSAEEADATSSLHNIAGSDDSFSMTFNDDFGKL